MGCRGLRGHVPRNICIRNTHQKTYCRSPQELELSHSYIGMEYDLVVLSASSRYSKSIPNGPSDHRYNCATCNLGHIDGFYYTGPCLSTGPINSKVERGTYPSPTTRYHLDRRDHCPIRPEQNREIYIYIGEDIYYILHAYIFIHVFSSLGIFLSRRFFFGLILLGSILCSRLVHGVRTLAHGGCWFANSFRHG